MKALLKILALVVALACAHVHAAPPTVLDARTFGVKCDGATNDYATLQAAINAAALVGGQLTFPPGTCNYGTTLVFKNKVAYVGAGKDASGTRGTTLRYTGVSDAVQINNPINSATPAEIVIRDLWVQSVTRTAGKGSIVDVGSTYLWLQRVGVSGNDHGLILDQSEVVEISQSQFETGTTGTCGIWLVNGAEHTGGGSIDYTNRVTVRDSQFNGTGGVGICDDGGYSHTIADNNFNAMAKHIRLNGGLGVRIVGNEMEAETTTSIEFATTKIGGGGGSQSSTVVIESNVISDSGLAIPLINFANNSAVLDLSVRNNHFGNTNAGGSPFGNFANGIGSGVYVGYGNFQGGISTATVGNTITRKTPYTPTFTSSNATAAIGNGTISGYYVRNGDTAKAFVNFTFGTTTTLGTGTFKFSLPFTGEGALVEVGSWYGSAAGNNKAGIVTNNGGASFVSVFEGAAAGFLGGASYAWVAGDFINLTVTYTITPTN